MSAKTRIQEVLQVLKALGMPREQQNDRTALCLLALLNLTPDKKWNEAKAPLVGITPMMEFARNHYGKKYAPNTRETFRRFSIHQMVQAGLVLPNPDNPMRPVNSPKTVYQVAPAVLDLFRRHGARNWNRLLAAYNKKHKSLATRYANARRMKRIPVRIEGEEVHLTPGKHSLLIRDAVEQFAPRFTPGAHILSLGDTGNKWALRDEAGFKELGIKLDDHGKMPDVVLHDTKRNWLLLVEVVTSHGPVNPKRQAELKVQFLKSKAGLVFVTVFPTRSIMNKYWNELAWETEVWVAEHPDHMIHLNGSRFLGPYQKPNKSRGRR
ncbi:MAG: restriction endonuclease [Lentisphaerae bacterium]|nr:restriction endonuclease [Lentisphaerota bacterium]